jgi:hypothetical protein
MMMELPLRRGRCPLSEGGCGRDLEGVKLLFIKANWSEAQGGTGELSGRLALQDAEC